MRVLWRALGLGLMAVVVLASLVRSLTAMAVVSGGSGEKVIRIAHWQLERGLRKALDAAITEYEKMNPGVRLEQVPIPERLGKNWGRTQLVGGTAPTIFQIGQTVGINDEMLSRYFLPLGAYVEEPNPYNRGTELEGIPWRDTFLDSLSSPLAFSPTLLEYYGVTGTVFVIRIFYNKALLHKVTGHSDTPETYTEFLELCRQVIEFNRTEQTAGNSDNILPIAGSKYNAPLIMQDLFAGLTQKLVFEGFPLYSHLPTQDSVVLGYLHGKWKWHSPAITTALSTMHQVGQFMQPGFLQLDRDDAMFYFAQQRALMLCTGSFDATSVRTQCRFDVGVFKFPIPSADDPEFSRFVMGHFSEGSTISGFSLGIVRNSPHTDIALDFLQFLSSRRGNEILSHHSGWLPGVEGVPIAETAKDFEPLLAGYPRGMEPRLPVFPDLARVYDKNFHHLVSAQGGVEQFLKAFEPDFDQALGNEIEARSRALQRNAASRDSAIAALDLGLRPGDREKAEALLEIQNQAELQRALFHHGLMHFQKSLKP